MFMSTTNGRETSYSDVFATYINVLPISKVGDQSQGPENKHEHVIWSDIKYLWIARVEDSSSC